jgi:hypothetical protein
VTVAKKPPSRKPTPKTISVVCSECGQDWGKHGKDPSLEDCVKLLKAALAAKSVQTWPQFTASSGVQPFYGTTTL